LGPGTKSFLTLTIIVYEMGCQPTEVIESVEIMVNGAPRRIPAGQTLSGLLHDLKLEPSRVAIEMDRRIVRRTEWDEFALVSGAKIEIVQFVGGG
jgi:sulfur carrier protein